MDFAIVVDGLVKRYGTRSAVAGLSLSIAPGEVFGLLGPNGAGKTTTVETLEGYRRPDEGTVRVLGLDPIRDGAALRPRIGVMLQSGGIYPGLMPGEALRLFAKFYVDAEDPDKLLELVGLREVRRTPVRRLSGGQYQRLSLALALVGKPELVFLDEPTAGLDPHARAMTWDLVRDLRAKGTTVVLTTHAMDEAEALCDRLAIIDHGRVVAMGTPSEITGTAHEIRLQTTHTLSTSALALALDLGPNDVVADGDQSIVLRCEPTPERLADLTIWLRDQRIALTDLQIGRRSLEQVFLQLTSDPELPR
ncbi:MAG: ABC transporter ATP-binding protein [Acidimicrobiia bacterium]